MSLVNLVLAQNRSVISRLDGNSQVFAARDNILGAANNSTGKLAPLQQDTVSFGGSSELAIASGNFQAKYASAWEQSLGKKIKALFEKGLSGFETFGR